MGFRHGIQIVHAADIKGQLTSGQLPPLPPYDALIDSGGWALTAPGWTANPEHQIHRHDQVVTVMISLHRTGGTLTGSATGDVADTALATLARPILVSGLPTPYGFSTPPPPTFMGFDPAVLVAATFTTGHAFGTVTIDSGGHVLLTTLHVGATIAAGDDVIATSTYLVP